MSEAGEIEPFDAAITADTGDEPKAVWEYFRFVESKVSFPIHVVRVGNLMEDFLAVLRGLAYRCSTPPFYVRQKPGHDPRANEVIPVKLQRGEFDFMADVQARRPDRSNILDRGGMLWRQCTADYKIAPIQKQVRKLLEESGLESAVQSIGISTDEAHRMKSSGVKYITNVFPLIDKDLSREACVAKILRAGWPRPPKSACKKCPFRSNRGWQWMKENAPDDFEEACQFDELMRALQATTSSLNGAKITGELFLWRGFAPLRTANFLAEPDGGLFDMSMNECEGMCGL